MKSVRTYAYRSVTLTSYTNGERESSPASSPFGPVRAGLTTTPDQGTLRGESLAQLTELLNYLESEATTLESKSLKVLSTLSRVIQPRVEHLLSTIEKDGTE